MGQTNISIQITIPNKKSRSNMKYSANFVKLSDYMDIDERLESDLKNMTKIEQEYGNIRIEIDGIVKYLIDMSSLLSSMKKLEDKYEPSFRGHLDGQTAIWTGYILQYEGNKEIKYNSDKGWERQEWPISKKTPADFPNPTEYRDQFGKVIDFSDEETFTWIHNKYMDPEDDKIM